MQLTSTAINGLAPASPTQTVGRRLAATTFSLVVSGVNKDCF